MESAPTIFYDFVEVSLAAEKKLNLVGQCNKWRLYIQYIGETVVP